jgi:hypothetical protein
MTGHTPSGHLKRRWAERRARGYRRSGPPLGASLRNDSRVTGPTPQPATRVRHSPEVQSPREALLRGSIEPGLRTGVGMVSQRRSAPCWRVSSAILSASSTSRVRMWPASCQPTTRREKLDHEAEDHGLFPAAQVREVRHPRLVRPGRGKLAVDPGRRGRDEWPNTNACLSSDEAPRRPLAPDVSAGGRSRCARRLCWKPVGSVSSENRPLSDRPAGRVIARPTANPHSRPTPARACAPLIRNQSSFWLRPFGSGVCARSLLGLGLAVTCDRVGDQAITRA